jgi:hypothetical protein
MPRCCELRRKKLGHDNGARQRETVACSVIVLRNRAPMLRTSRNKTGVSTFMAHFW